MSVAVLSAWTDSFLSALGSRKRKTELVFRDGQGRTGTYIGEVANGKANGYGKWLSASDQVNAPVCEGDYVDNELHGHATKTWCAGPFAGNRYTGGFRNDRKHGVGSYYWATGDRCVRARPRPAPHARAPVGITGSGATGRDTAPASSRRARASRSAASTTTAS